MPVRPDRTPARATRLVAAARRWRPGRGSRGQSMVEFALVLPVLLVLLMIATDFGRAYLGWVNLNRAAREAANYAAQNPRGWVGSGEAVIQAR